MNPQPLSFDILNGYKDTLLCKKTFNHNNLNAYMHSQFLISSFNSSHASTISTVCQGTWLHDGLSRRVVEKFVHEDFNPGNHEEFLIRDISLLKVSTKITKDNRSIDNFFRKKIIIIDKIYYQCNLISNINIGGFPEDLAGENVLDCVVIGFGLINEHIRGTEGFISRVKVKHGKKACREYNRYLICTNNSNGTCDGDNGGPMICNGLQNGICSFALNFYGEKESVLCGNENIQTVHVFFTTIENG
ncbi:hypothetical protein QTP88_019021 [Uroleucon formosanum]